MDRGVDSNGWEWADVDGEKVYLDPMRGHTHRPIDRPRAEDGTLLPRPRREPRTDLTVLVEAIRTTGDPDLEDCYWALVAEDQGRPAADSWKREYEWLKERRRRLERMADKPALGMFRAGKGSPPAP